MRPHHPGMDFLARGERRRRARAAHTAAMRRMHKQDEARREAVDRVLAGQPWLTLGAARRAFGVSTRKIGGLRFLKIGRLTLSWSVSRRYRPL